MSDQNINNHALGEDEELPLNLDIYTEIHFSRKNHPEGKMIPVSVDGKEEFVLIPLDIKDGDTIKFKGKGKYNSSSGKTGDLYVLVHIEEKKVSRKVILISVLVATAIAIALFLFRKPASPPQPTTEPALATSCDHVWIPADCTTPKTCKICGETSGTPLEHQWQEATYDAPKTCSVCGITDGIPLEKPVPTIEVNDIVIFGNYEQDGIRSNGSEPIEWLVLDVEEDCVLLLSRYALDSKPYNNTYGVTTWEECSLRSWLNGAFLNAAFTSDEKRDILVREINNSVSESNDEWRTSGGRNTEDAVFLLSYADTDRYFTGSMDRICMPTSYAIAMGADTRISDDGVTEAGWWWLRSPGESNYQASFVNFDGTRYTNSVANGYLSVRPALWVRLAGVKSAK